MKGVMKACRYSEAACFADAGHRRQRIQIAAADEAQHVADELQREPQHQHAAAERHQRRRNPGRPGDRAGEHVVLLVILQRALEADLAD
ncbi:hypothetical protein ACVWZR_005886 [Bradyrhizobium sp. i1.3.1]